MVLQLRKLVTVVVFSLALGLPVPAADLNARPEPPPGTEAVSGIDGTRHYLTNQALLLMIRATFDVVDRDGVGDILNDTATRLGARGPAPEESAALDRTLLSEASYYIVSLRYVTLVGGAVWPDDRPESDYANDAIVLLDSLERDLHAAVAEGTDALPVLLKVQDLWLLSEGQKSVPFERNFFADRDELVEQALGRIKAGA